MTRIDSQSFVYVVYVCLYIRLLEPFGRYNYLNN